MKTLASFVCALLLVWQTTSTARAQCHAVNVVEQNMTVMLNARDSIGAGIIFAVRGASVYVVTAKHVVSEVGSDASLATVKFRNEERARVKSIYKATSKGLDVAFLAIEDRALVEKLQQTLSWQILRSRSFNRASPDREFATIVGQGGGEEWVMPLEPEPVSGQEKDKIKIQSTTVGPGFSGGSVFDPSGQLIGIIVNDTGRLAEALPIETALNEARRLGLPVDLTEAKLTPAAIFVAPVTGIPEDWDPLIRESIRKKLEPQLEKRGFRLLQCEANPRTMGIFGSVEIRRPTLTTDVAIVKWRFNYRGGLSNIPEPQRIEFIRFPWTDIWVKGSTALMEHTDELGDYAVNNFMKGLQ